MQDVAAHNKVRMIGPQNAQLGETLPQLWNLKSLCCCLQKSTTPSNVYAPVNILANFTPKNSPDEIAEHITLDNRNLHNHNTCVLNVFPDSSATICLTGPEVLVKFNISTEDLILCQKQICVVGGSTIPCIGWIHVEFKVESVTTHERLYICDNTNCIYFSKNACINTNILPKSFPKPINTENAFSVMSVTLDTDLSIGSLPSMLNTRKPPVRPASLPFPATVENILLIKQHIIDSFNNSAFNNDPPFPTMNAKPAHIHLKPGAIPHAVHSPISVPEHWKAETKAQLDRDGGHGIIKKVPIGTPVEWCAPMVVVEKKSSSTPRRVVDYPQLNRKYSRETHRSDSPFQLASRVYHQT